MKWGWGEGKQVLQTIPFVVEERRLSRDGVEIPEPFHRLLAPDWVNVLPVTSDGRVVLVKQFRAGTLQTCLETPGGCVDPGDSKDVQAAALRELEEETGYRGDTLELLGSFEPNPAFQNNRIHFFIAKDVYIPTTRQVFPDEYEDFEIVLMPIRDALAKVRSGQISHGLCALCLLLASESGQLKLISP